MHTPRSRESGAASSFLDSQTCRLYVLVLSIRVIKYVIRDGIRGYPARFRGEIEMRRKEKEDVERTDRKMGMTRRGEIYNVFCT